MDLNNHSHHLFVNTYFMLLVMCYILKEQKHLLKFVGFEGFVILVKHARFIFRVTWNLSRVDHDPDFCACTAKPLSSRQNFLTSRITIICSALCTSLFVFCCYSDTACTSLCSVCRLFVCIHPLSPSSSWVNSGKSFSLHFSKPYLDQF